MHDTLTIGIPVFFILLGVVLNQRAFAKLGTRMDARFDPVDARFDALCSRLDRLRVHPA